jgi:hypothetical protein
MSIYGNIRTMSLPDLLQWASVNKKTGVLELERNKICKRISFRAGRIVACSSDDPPSRLGQFLLSRGKIDKDQLREALGRQESESGKNLGEILQEMGALTKADVDSHVAAKAEENIYGLFDWRDAVFRFHDTIGEDPFVIEVDLQVQDVVLKGIQRFDDLTRIRDSFTSSGIVLRRTERTLPPEVTASPMARRVLDSVDGRRTLAEILLHAHASEFLVLKFLHTLTRKGLVSIIEVRDPDPNSRTLLDPAELPTAEAAAMLPASSEIDRPQDDTDEVVDSQSSVETALQSIARGEYAVALDILNGAYRAQPDDNHLRRLLLKAEAGYLEQARCGEFSPDRIPVPVASVDVLKSALKPTELFLLSMLDGQSDIKSITWLAPLREVDVVKALKRMVDERLIELRDPPDARPTDGGPDSDEKDVPSVQWSPL